MFNKISVKLTSGFGICLLLLMTVVAVNFQALQKLEKLYHRTVQCGEELELASDAQHIGEDLYQIIANSVINRDLAGSARLWTAGKKTALEKLARISRAAETREEKADVGLAGQAISDIVDIYERQMLPLIQRGAPVPGPLSEIDAQIDQRIDIIEISLRHFAQSVSRDAQATNANYHQVLNATIRSGLAISLAGVLIAFATSAWVTRLIVRPLREVTRAILGMERGEHPVQIAHKSNDELGILADSFRTMSGRVEKRTAQLTESNAKLQREIGERARAEEAVRTLNAELEGRVRERTAELTSLYEHLQTVREEERASISRDIHDDLGQLLTAMKIDLQWLKKRLPGDDARLAEKAGQLEGYFNDAIGIVKRISADLRPVLLDDLGLSEALEWYGREFTKRTGIACTVEIDCDCAHLDQDRSTALFRIFQEALTNVCRHAEATRVCATLEESGEELLLRVSDDGRGAREEELRDPRSLGIVGMRERARFLGGALAIESRPGAGTSVCVGIPLGKAPEGVAL
ncbi:hypothetical protein GMST_19080 [Geomonas silvestris]|uniref:histidine kinase n=1 Tax=Geomonas silvestris TaxID=2740184 RepID=A0A6V8MIG2_9BACT|nr:histidine kinase [Geomonas silvestris]GFO59583.1 hypothetical protein GMST_19080 [Geomonas silvestris]